MSIWKSKSLPPTMPMMSVELYPGGGRSSKSATLPSGVLSPVFLPLLAEAASSGSSATSKPEQAMLQIELYREPSKPPKLLSEMT